MNKKPSILKAEQVPDQPKDAPPGWTDVQEKLATASGLSILLVNGHQPPALVASNNNSICEAFQSSPEHSGLCEPYCGEAHRRALASGSITEYTCHAGLHCFTMPVQLTRKQNLAVIGGRAFVSTSEYRSLLERFRNGDLQTLLERNPFSNIIFAEPQRLEQLSGRIEKAAQHFNGSSPVQSAKIQREGIQAAKAAPDLQRQVDALRSELEFQSRFTESLQHFLSRINSTDPAKTYLAVLNNSKELLQAERASLQMFDEAKNELAVKAAAGLPLDPAEMGRLRLGEGISGAVLEAGKPLIVENIEETQLKPTTTQPGYKTKSFISYPIMLGGRRIGVLNITDKSSGGHFDRVDLSLLEMIGPQVALALDRADWQEKATEFQLMSITDPLTGLLNRRYLQERLTEELNRSKRYDFAMCFLMIDIDDFKSYNDINGHQAGDQALQITAHCLKDALRSADVASRYGGEEFCVLLPQTSINEAAVIAERMRQRVVNTAYPHGRSQPLGCVSVSIGISTFSKHIDTAEKIIAAADRALYNSKSQGKNQVEFYQENLVTAFKSNDGE